ncbi:hypothetical protein CLOM_g1593 [Closterium sp. NIES-68]|nr:hypothetical protein CLOM_g1593 [Closterium sp. NIES-68]GJP58355.1 hypothetical protein CLOP_g23277 [Closterium sp. NIES-67]GJP82729.1 hypothetical protein CLOP_g12973 [Closterium sp. NIES-67]
MASDKPLSTGGTAASGLSDVPGEAKTMTTRVMETGASTVQQFRPIRQIGQHLCAFHYYASDMSRQVEAHHYCSHVNEDVHQCLVYDSDQPSARLIGVEFIVSEEVFLTLPEAEQRMWHAHEYEVKSGLLFMPGLPAIAEQPIMAKLVKTFGKTWHFWQFDRGDALPLGVPQLMGAFFADGQLKPELPRVEQRYGVQMEERRKMRADLKGPERAVDQLAEQIKRGMGLETELKECALPGKEGPGVGGVGVAGMAAAGKEHVGQVGRKTTGSDPTARIGG